MRSALAVVAIVLPALFVGLGSAWMTVKSPAPIDAIRIRAWQAWPNAGTAEVDPYSHARLSRTGEIPLGSGEGLALFAAADDSGEPLHFFCDYSVHGQTPPARLWTVAIEDQEGRNIADGSDPRALGSESILRQPDGGFRIAVSRRASSGNWLSSAGTGQFRIVLRLYDTTARSVTGISRLVMPRIERDRCA